MIEQFIDEHLANLKDSDDIPNAFEEFWNNKKEKAFLELCQDENADAEKLNKVVGDYLYTNQKIQRDDVIESLDIQPKILDRKNISERVIQKIYDFVETFVSGL